MLCAVLAAASGTAAPQPDRATPPASGGKPADFGDTSGPDSVNGGGTNRYLRIAGSDFVPRYATTEAIFAGAGCIRSSVVGAIFTADVQLPAGAVVQYVRTYYYNDGVSAGISTYFTDYNGLGASTEHTSFTTGTSDGYTSTLSPPIAVTISPITDAYSMVVMINSTSTNLRFCGVRIQYVP